MAYSQQDVKFPLNAHLLPGKNIIKVKRDFKDPYLWVLAQNNEVYRVNSITLAVDDYTAKFSAYSNLQFVDIAGRSQDTVFIATNSTNVIEYKNGGLRLIGTADGIPGTVNSVGIAGAVTNSIFLKTNVLMIATDKGFRLYNSDTETISDQDDTGNSKVYEATYRTEMYKDSSAATTDFITQDTILYQPATYVLPGGPIVNEYLWEGGKEFGYNTNTALVVYDAIFGYNEVYSNSFWGNSNGLNQNYTNYSYYSIMSPSGHYLNGINVNKISSIYGLTSFGSGGQFTLPGLARQNLLVGTDQGFYFSNSILTNAPYPLRPFSLFHDDELGNIVINDICVDAISTNQSICEDGIWLAAINGLYLVTPDYGGYLGNPILQAINFKDQPANLSKIDICAGSSVQAEVNTSTYAGNNYQWYKNGNELPGENAATLSINSPGTYDVVLYSPCSGLHLTSNQLQVNLIANPVFTFDYPDELQYCAGTPVTLHAVGSANYQYRWYQDGTLNGNVTASMTVTAVGKYKVEVSACGGSWVASKEVQVNFIQLIAPVITADKAAYCVGDNATLSIAATTDPDQTINWYKDNVLLTANTNQTSITTNIAGNYTVTVVSNAPNTNGSICSQTSAVQSVSFNPPPTVSIEKIVNTTICDGQTINLLAHYNEGSIKWSTGETTDQIGITATGNYTATVTSTAGCVANANIDVSFLPNPVFSVPDTSICTYKKQAVTLTAPSGFSQYAWNGTSGGQTYQVTQPGTISLTVTDTNGCQATQQIKITDQCPNIYIPNTFTPNGDGINDTWVIEGLDSDPTTLIRVFTRYGTEIYESKGYGIPWNGEYNGKKLPSGVYYYIVTAKNETQKFSGSLTIIY